MIIKSSTALCNDYSMISDLAHEEAEQREERRQHQHDARGDFSRQITAVDFHRKKRAKESTAMRRKNSRGSRQNMNR